MRSVQKSLRLALVAAIAVVASAAESQAASRFVFGKEPVARHNRAQEARREQAARATRMTASPSSRMYGGTAMVQTYPAPSSRTTVTPVAGYRMPSNGYRVQQASNWGYTVR
jgi:hypothetical protein